MTALVLAIDATSPLASAALAEAGEPLSEAVAPARGGRALVDLVDEAFRSARRAPAALDALIAVNGPGSFTGVRVTLATALGLASILPARSDDAEPALQSISSLAALALQAPTEARTMLALIDALRGERFGQRFARDAHGLRPLDEPARAEAHRFALDGVEAIVALPGGAEGLAPGAPPVVEARALALLVAVAGSRGDLARLLSRHLVPLYLRAPAVTLAARGNV